MVHIAESTVGRRYAGWFIRNTEHAQRVYDAVKNSALPARAKPNPSSAQPQQQQQPPASATAPAPKAGGAKVAWGAVKVN